MPLIFLFSLTNVLILGAALYVCSSFKADADRAEQAVTESLQTVALLETLRSNGWFVSLRAVDFSFDKGQTWAVSASRKTEFGESSINTIYTDNLVTAVDQLVDEVNQIRHAIGTITTSKE